MVDFFFLLLIEIENIFPVNRLQFWAGKQNIYNNNNNVEYKKKIKRIGSNIWRNSIKFCFLFVWLFFSKEMESGTHPVPPFG